MKQHPIKERFNQVTKANKNTRGLVIAAILMTPMFFVIGAHDANAASIRCTGTLTTGSNPFGNAISSDFSTVWVALSGTGQIATYSTSPPDTSCQSITYKTVGGDPTWITLSGSSRVVFTEYNSMQVGVWNTATNSLERTVSVPYHPRDIYTDPSNSDKVWFTEGGTHFASMLASTGTVTQYTLPDSTANSYAIGADSSYVFITDIANNKYYRFDKSSSYLSNTITEGFSYGLTPKGTDVWGTLWTPNELLDVNKLSLSYAVEPGHSGTSNMYRIDWSASDVFINYKTVGYTSAIHIFPYSANGYHALLNVGILANDVKFDNQDSNNPGADVTRDGTSSDNVYRTIYVP